jgi:hypothetical protein
LIHGRFLLYGVEQRSMKSNLLIVALLAVLTGCATQPSGVSDDQVAKFREQGLTVGHVNGGSAVALKTKGKAVGAFMLSTLAASAVASNPASITPQGMQDAQELGRATGDLVQRGVTAIGNNVHQTETPAAAMAAALTHSLSESGMRTDGAAYHIDIKQTQWLLSYDSMFGSDNYRLHWQLDASVRNSADKVVTASVCRGDDDTKQALDTWKANDYAQVKEVARRVGETCAKQLLNDVGLHG